MEKLFQTLDNQGVGVVENYSLFVMQNINIDYDIIDSADTTLLSPPTDIDIDDV